MKLVLSGATGAMGQVVQTMVKQRKDMDIVAGWAEALMQGDIPMVTDLNAIVEPFDVILDFSTHETVQTLIPFALAFQRPLVIATTGHTEEEKELILTAAQKIPIFYSGNMSLGVYVMCQLSTVAAQLLSDYDLEVIEAHHHFKTDAPSGTAKMVVEACKEVRPGLKEMYGREGHVGARSADEIGIHAVRGGTIVGEHTLLLAGEDECLKITHTAFSKKIFAKGALEACSFLQGQTPGLYDMDDMLKGNQSL